MGLKIEKIKRFHFHGLDATLKFQTEICTLERSNAPRRTWSRGGWGRTPGRGSRTSEARISWSCTPDRDSVLLKFSNSERMPRTKGRGKRENDDAVQNKTYRYPCKRFQTSLCPMRSTLMHTPSILFTSGRLHRWGHDCNRKWKRRLDPLRKQERGQFKKRKLFINVCISIYDLHYWWLEVNDFSLKEVSND